MSNEPKKSAIEAAVKRRWPDSIGTYINQRKHTMRVMFNAEKKDPRDFEISARSHRELLQQAEAT